MFLDQVFFIILCIEMDDKWEDTSLKSSEQDAEEMDIGRIFIVSKFVNTIYNSSNQL